MEEHKYYFLTDALHGRAIVAGASRDGHVYHQENKEEYLHAAWCFKPVKGAPGCFYIVDARDQLGIAAGVANSGPLFHQDYEDRDVATWEVKPGVVTGSFTFTDQKYRLSIVAPDGVSMDLYHQPHGRRPNSCWFLRECIKVEARNGPGFLPVAVEIVNWQSLPDPRIGGAQVIFKSEDIVRNDDANTLRHWIDATWQETQSETVSFAQSLSESVLQMAAATFDMNLIHSLGKATANLTKTDEKTTITVATDGRSATKTSTLSAAYKTKVSVLPKTAVLISCVLRRQPISMPFTAQLRTTFADHSVKVEALNGIWTGALTAESEITVTTIP
jgi:hypothetical protein